jgi:hypothetical protein
VLALRIVHSGPIIDILYDLPKRFHSCGSTTRVSVPWVLSHEFLCRGFYHKSFSTVGSTIRVSVPLVLQ